jgi:hypothetical protein
VSRDLFSNQSSSYDLRLPAFEIRFPACFSRIRFGLGVLKNIEAVETESSEITVAARGPPAKIFP